MKDKTVIVTGVAGGLGRAIAEEAGREGARLAVVTEGHYRRQMAIGLDAVYWGIQVVTPHMLERGAGSIVNMTSPASVHGIPNGSVYAAVKGAISALTRQCAVELGQQGIRVNAVAPGPMPTPGTMRVVDEEAGRSA